MMPAEEAEENRLMKSREDRVRRKLASKGYVLNKVPLLDPYLLRDRLHGLAGQHRAAWVHPSGVLGL